METVLELGDARFESLIMPVPGKNETRKDFVERCIPIVIEDGTAADGKQGAAICNSIWRESKKEVVMSDEITVDTIEETEDLKDKPNHKQGVIASVIPFDATSFEDIDEFMKAETVRERMGEVTRQFETLTHNIMYSGDDVDKIKAMKSLVIEFEGRLGEAIDLGSTTIWDVVKNTFQRKEPAAEPKTKNGLFVWKEGERYRWFAVYSNKYRDDDTPPEIISEKAHVKFVEMVDNGDVPYPELWHWHLPGSRWGESDWIAYDDELGFSLASGFIDRGHEKEAETIMDLDEPLAVSHGLHILKRNENDETIIEQYVSHEISDLPLKAAANKLTGFSLIEAKENDMIPDEKKQHLLSVGLTEEKIDEIESDLESKASEAIDAGLEFKENVPEVDPEVEVTENKPDDETTETEKDEIEVVDLTEPVTRQEVAEAITETIKPISDQMGEIAASIEQLQTTDKAKIQEIADDTPAFSIAHLVNQNLSAIGKDATKVDDEKEGDRPVENDHDEKSITGVPWIDTMLVGEG